MPKKTTSKKPKVSKSPQQIDDDFVSIFGLHIKRETKNGIVAIGFFVLAILFALSGFELGGVAGDFIYKTLFKVLGVGYILLPIVFVLLGFSSYKSQRPTFGASNTVSSLLFLISGLGLIHIIDYDSAGIIGRASAWPFVKLFDVYLAFILLLALFVISLVVMFDKRPSLSGFLNRIKSIFGKKETEEEYYEEEVDDSEEHAEEVEEKETVKEPEPIVRETPEPPKESFALSAAWKSSGKYIPPPLTLLRKNDQKAVTGDIKANSNIIKRTLQNFGIDVEMDEVTVGPTVTRFALKPAQGVRLSRITALQNELRLALAAPSIRIQAPIPGLSLVGIEVPNQTKAMVDLRSLLSSKEFKESSKPLLVSLGRSVSGKAEYANIAKMPHLLVAGATGAGKSVTVHTLITSLLYRNGPEDLRFIMIDPKRVELTLYNGIPHLLTPVITNPKKAILALKWAISEMERRYDILEGHAVRDIDSYHQKYNKNKEELESMPYILIFIDELADIMQSYPRELESGIVRLAQMSRAVGIHLTLSTQRPSVNVITGLIKANVPTRIALQVASQIDSRTILDAAGAEKLLGAGDMLYSSGEMAQPNRVQGAYISEDEVKSIADYLKNRYKDELPDDLNLGEGSISSDKSIFNSSLDDDSERDDMFEEAKRLVISEKKASTSYIQRRLKIGYSRAARILDELEEAGVVGPGNGAKPREILMDGSETVKVAPSPVAQTPKISPKQPSFHSVTRITEEDNDTVSEEEENEEYEQVFTENPIEDDPLMVELDQEEGVPEELEDSQKQKEEYDENDKY
jgi:S-DNA-T family DNA segregation ATPase FtsK/SpoIIIE